VLLLGNALAQQTLEVLVAPTLPDAIRIGKVGSGWQGPDRWPEQIAGKGAVRHESVYLNVFANNSAGVDLHRYLRSQKPQLKRHLCGRYRLGQIPNRRPISERLIYIDDRTQVGHWKVILSLTRLTNKP
jgi:IS30 family transposase